MAMDWNVYLECYQRERGGCFFGTRKSVYDCQLVLTEGENYPILAWVDSDPNGKYSVQNIKARTMVQLDGEYELHIRESSLIGSGVKGVMGLVGGGNDFGFPEATRGRVITTNNKPFTKQVLGDLELRNRLMSMGHIYLRIAPAPGKEGWHMVEVGDYSFEGSMKGRSAWVCDAMSVDTLYMEEKDRLVVQKAACDHFKEQMDAFLQFLRAAQRAVTTWRMT